ncbi:MAG TPA: helix-turn-helix domain-containing protein [Thermoplasmata archaeon]|nr:helix-turn-helix domain-containing protein [Thermoplasmata archaeon]
MSGHHSEVKISRLLADDYSQKILSYTYRKAMSAQRLSKICRIPIAACYRRIHDLEKAGLIFISDEREIRNGRKVKLYRCSLKSATLRFSNGKFKVDYDTSNGNNSMEPMMNGGNMSYKDSDSNGSGSENKEEKPHVLHQSS